MHWQIEPIPAWRWEATKPTKRATFGASYEATLDLLWRELKQLDCRGAVAVLVVCAPEDVRRDGMLRAQAQPRYHGVALSATTKHGPMTYPCDTFAGGTIRRPAWQDNLRAIALSLEALRKVDRYGMASHGEQYRGWRAIEAAPAVGFASVDEAVDWLRELTDEHDPGIRVSQLLRRAAGIAHPDRNGGRRDLWNLYDAARQLINGAAA